MNLPEEQRKELETLSYFADIRERRAWIARMTVLIAVLGLLILNIFLMYLSASAIILNIDLSRLEQSDQFDLVERRLEYLDHCFHSRHGCHRYWFLGITAGFRALHLNEE